MGKCHEKIQNLNHHCESMSAEVEGGMETLIDEDQTDRSLKVSQAGSAKKSKLIRFLR